jgi:pantothenate synthetase
MTPGNYRKAPSRTPSRNTTGKGQSFGRQQSNRRSFDRNRNQSTERQDQNQELSLKERVTKLEKNSLKGLENQKELQKTLEEILKKMKNVNFVKANGEELDEIVVEIANVMFLKEITAVDTMLMDTGVHRAL